jgi:hypothetical protein
MQFLLRSLGFGSVILALAAPAAAAAPREVVMRQMTSAEEAAHRIWTLRAALNVAALQCQFSPALQTVGKYNDMLRHHSIELAAAFKTLGGHFARHDGKRGGQSALDRYTTRVYNGFSTLDAQRTFCAAAGEVGADVLFIRKGTLAPFASDRLQGIRDNLIAKAEKRPRVDMSWVVVPPIPDPCINAKGKRIKRC